MNQPVSEMERIPLSENILDARAESFAIEMKASPLLQLPRKVVIDDKTDEKPPSEMPRHKLERMMGWVLESSIQTSHL